MTIAILGAGNVGQALATALVRQQHVVRFGVPEPSKYSELPAQLGGDVGVTTVAAAVADSDLVILATPYAAALQIARELNDWNDRIVIDATNPIAPGLSGLLVGTNSSGAEEIARLAHNARVVKAFNTTGFDNMTAPHYPAGDLFMPVAGDDVDARNRVIALATQMGFDGVDMGGLASARYLEPWAMVWIELAMRRGHGRQFGFVRQNRRSMANES